MSSVVHDRAASEMGCSDVDVEDLGSQSFTATGCGRTATYTCVRTGYGGTLCVHDEATRSTPAITATAANAVAQPTPKNESAPPTGAAGFEFGVGRDGVRKACESANHSYVETGSDGECDGFATDLGQTGKTRIHFCGAKVCTVSLIFDRRGETVEQSVVRWKRALADKYGEPHENRSNVPPGCSDVGDCIVTHLAAVDVAWAWPSHQSIHLSVPARDNVDALRVEVRYQAPESVANGL